MQKTPLLAFVTVLCKSNANEFQRISFFVLANFLAKFARYFTKFHAKSFTVKRYFERHIEKYCTILRKDKRKSVISKIPRIENSRGKSQITQTK